MASYSSIQHIARRRDRTYGGNKQHRRWAHTTSDHCARVDTESILAQGDPNTSAHKVDKVAP
eukprot:scaffold2462_cov402-Prasinococcus_capsulatus_cf.AAC.24